MRTGFTFRNGGGRQLVCWTLLPSEHVIAPSGRSRERILCKRAVIIRLTARPTRNPAAGRVEVSPVEANADDIFLHVIQVGLDDGFVDAEVAAVEEGERTGRGIATRRSAGADSFQRRRGSRIVRFGIERNSGMLAEEIIGVR